ncbi:MAG: polyketide cyclase [Candidatus Tectimicrobiota bacterium]|nr:MAG: polyketide cyclase [Candidatus Tectomicrobia bacterium]
MQAEWLYRFWQQQASGRHEGEPGQGEGLSRRDFVKAGLVTGMAAGMAAGHLARAPHAAEAAPAEENPMGRQWWPSEWGPEDEAGASNRITPAKVLEAASLIKRGHIYRLGMVLEAGIPTFGARHVSITIPGGPTGGPFGKHQLMYNDEMFSGEIGQVGSQFDGLGHIGVKMGNTVRYYNGFTQEQVGGAYGLKKLGVHNVKPFFTRGILLDVLSLKGGERLPIGYVITMDDVMQTLRRQGIREPGEGDVVLFRTGHIKLWMKDNAEYNRGCPGPSKTVAEWLAEKKIACVGADTWPVEAVPGEDPDRPFICHVIWITMNGIYIIENQWLEDLAKDRVYEFAWSFNPLPLKGGTGSPGNSVAIA